MENRCERCDHVIEEDIENDGLVSYKESCIQCENKTDEELMRGD